MITGTPWSPGTAFIAAAHNILEGAAAGDFGVAFQHLDTNDDGSRWSKAAFLSDVAAIAPGSITSPGTLRRSAEPQLTGTGDVYLLQHRIPVDGAWSAACLLLRFNRVRGEQFRMQLVGVVRV
jgi:hypothetical protein